MKYKIVNNRGADYKYPVYGTDRYIIVPKNSYLEVDYPPLEKDLVSGIEVIEIKDLKSKVK